MKRHLLGCLRKAFLAKQRFSPNDLPFKLTARGMCIPAIVYEFEREGSERDVCNSDCEGLE
jgi:hypothetical protein